MSFRRFEHFDDAHIARGPSGPGPGQDRQAVSAAGPHEQIDYLADMIRELRDMADRAETTTLTRILDLAYHEAQEQLARRAKR